MNKWLKRTFKKIKCFFLRRTYDRPAVPFSFEYSDYV